MNSDIIIILILVLFKWLQINHQPLNPDAYSFFKKQKQTCSKDFSHPHELYTKGPSL